jgi:hypothetical protein
MRKEIARLILKAHTAKSAIGPVTMPATTTTARTPAAALQVATWRVCGLGVGEWGGWECQRG